MTVFFKDLLHGCRLLARNPGFALVAVLALALGIGANSAMFSIINGVLLRPLLYRDPDRLVLLYEKDARGNRDVFNSKDFRQIRDRSHVFQDLAAYVVFPMSLTGGDQVEQLGVPHVSWNYFRTLGLEPMLGRTFLPEEVQPGKERVIVLAHEFWQRRFGADPAVIGRTVTLNRNAYTVVGVLSSGAHDYSGRQVWVPLALELFPDVAVNIIGRLQTGASAAQALAEVDTMARALEEADPKARKRHGAIVIPVLDSFVGQIRRALLLFQAAVGFLLLIACANVANLLLARAVSRRKEIAVRVMLGAGRWRLVAQLMSETLPLAILGAAAGLAIAYWTTTALPLFLPDSFPRAAEIRVDRSVFGFTAGVALLTVLAFGLAPALFLSSPEDAGRTRQGTSRGSARLRNLFLGTEIALSLVLLVGAGLLIRSFLALQRVDLGFRPERLLTLKLTIPESKFRRVEDLAAYFERIIDRVNAMPGVESAAASTFVPLASGVGLTARIRIEGQPQERSREEAPANMRLVSNGYFRAIGIPLVQGRGFQQTDTYETTPVVVVSQSVARRAFAGQDPIGKRILLPKFGTSLRALAGENIPHEIIGIVGDVKDRGLDERESLDLYVPIRQSSVPYTAIVIRTKLEPLALRTAVRREIAAVDKEQPVGDVRSMDQWIAAIMGKPRLNTFLLGVFAALALLLAMSGVYGLAAYSVRQRGPELGVRMALGASPRQVVGLVLWQGLKLVLISSGIGMLAAVGMTRLLAGLLYGVTPTDPLTLVAAPLLVAVVALAAMYIPAREAARIDPAAALRHD